MGREVKIVNLDFDWYDKHKSKTWKGYLFDDNFVCFLCDGNGKNIKGNECPLCCGEGKVAPTANTVGLYAETFYTLNGKDPIRTKSYLYKYNDYNDYVSVIRETNPSTFTTDPSANLGVYSGSLFDDNIGDLSFRLRRNYAGEDNIILKAKTYYRGDTSDIAISKFRIYNPDIEDVNDRKM